MRATAIQAKNLDINDLETITIPAHAREWPMAQMPLSVRLEGVLQRMGFRESSRSIMRMHVFKLGFRLQTCYYLGALARQFQRVWTRIVL
ncbi:MAG TPA: hypothetical protein P5055_08470 [Candidatus Paceibacterota bacterium]|nr:hypothetical protein [Candidatus Paceibacterota bacterium]